MGSQGLRESELDTRRELGIIIEDSDVVHALVKTFESDWASVMPARDASRRNVTRSGRTLSKSAKAVVRELPLAPIVEEALKRVIEDHPTAQIRGGRLRMSDDIREAVEDAVSVIVKGRNAVSA